MHAGAMHPSASTQDLIRATRPKFPEGLKVLVVVKDESRHAPIKKLLQEIGYKVTCANTLDKGLNVLESAQGNSDVNAHFDVALVEEEQVAPIMRDVMNGTNSSPLFGRFTTIAKEVAIVLMHEDEDVASKTYMIEAIKVGVVDVVKYPLVKQSMRTLWQHAVRKIIRQQTSPRTRMRRLRAEGTAEAARNVDPRTGAGGSPPSAGRPTRAIRPRRRRGL